MGERDYSIFECFFLMRSLNLGTLTIQQVILNIIQSLFQRAFNGFIKTDKIEGKLM
ncbi:hypothetical protein J32TS6_32920 [Virgibacillus pantothenticus]|nr:hypothetical protein J32TS6_32920 [Virgibacillus pantothenticus]